MRRSAFVVVLVALAAVVLAAAVATPRAHAATGVKFGLTDDAWLENGQLVHVVFEGYPPGTFPPMCEGQPCFGGREPNTEQVAGRTVTWYDHNLASHTGHIAAIFHSLGNVYVISIHVATPVSTVADAKSDLRHIIRSLAPVQPKA